MPNDLDLNAVREAIEETPGVISVHHLHAWSLTSGKDVLSTHVLVSDYSEGIQQALQTLMKTRFNTYFSTVQIETEVCGLEDDAQDIDFLAQAGAAH